MEKERNFRNVLIGVLCVTVFCMSIGFAYMQQLLTVNGTLNVDSATWDVHFGGITANAPVGTATSNSASLDSAQKVATFDLTLKAPGDSQTYTLQVVNEGTLDAKVSSVVINPTSGSTIDTENNIIVTSTGISDGDVITATTGVQTFTITFTYNAEARNLSASTDEPYSYTATINYEQDH